MNMIWYDLDDICTMSERIGAIKQSLAKIYMPPLIEKDRPHERPLIVKEGTIRFEDVTFRFAPHMQPLLKNFSLTIPAKQKVGIIGYSGSGKSTFVKLLLRLHDIQQGSISIDGQDIEEVTRTSLYKNIRLVPQEAMLFHRSLKENIQYGSPSVSQRKMTIATKRAKIYDFIRKHREGYNFLVAENSSNISGGQRQRVTIARALLKDFSILILDEATSQLDGMNEEHILDTFIHLGKDKTMIVVAHRIATLRHMERILVFDSGKIIEDGTHQELLTRGGCYAQLYRMQHIHPAYHKDD